MKVIRSLLYCCLLTLAICALPVQAAPPLKTAPRAQPAIVPFPTNGIKLTAHPWSMNSIAIGVDLSMVVATNKFDCVPSTNLRRYDEGCTLKERYFPAQFPYDNERSRHNPEEFATLMGVPLTDIDLLFFGRILHTIRIVFAPREFSHIARGLEFHFGPPEIKEELVQNALGATFKNTTLWWRHGDTVLMAIRYDQKIDTASITIQADIAVTENARRVDAAIRQ